MKLDIPNEANILSPYKVSLFLDTVTSPEVNFSFPFYFSRGRLISDFPFLVYCHSLSCFQGMAGGQSEYVRLPFGNNTLLKIPDSVPDEKALYLSDVLITSYHCVVDTGVKQGDIVGIWGSGPS